MPGMVMSVCGSRKTPDRPGKTKPRALSGCWLVLVFDIVVGDWNESYFSQLESFPASKFKDMVDATNDAFAELERKGEFGFSF